MADKEIIVSEQVLQVPFKYSAGPVVSRFLVGLRDERAIHGIKCPSCNKVYVPPRATCGSCFAQCEGWVRLKGEGTIETFTEISYSETTHPRPAPYVIALIRLDGADTSLLHLVADPGSELAIGDRVKPVFADQRTGHILDISHFDKI